MGSLVESPAARRSFPAFWVLLALLAASLDTILAKLGYRTLAVSPWQLLCLWNLFAALVILPVTRQWHWIGWGGLGRVASVSLQLMMTNAASLVAVQRLPAVTVITLVTTTPAFVGITNQFLGRDRLTRKFWLGFLCAFLGILLSIDAFSGEPFGRLDAVGLLAVAVCIASSTIYRTRMEGVTARIPPILVSTYIFLINGLVSLVFIAPHLDPIPAAAWPLGLWLGVAAAIANVAFLYALSLVGSTNMSIFNMLQRPLVIVLACLILAEPLSPTQILGVVLVLLGVRMAQVKRAPRRA